MSPTPRILAFVVILNAPRSGTSASLWSVGPWVWVFGGLLLGAGLLSWITGLSRQWLMAVHGDARLAPMVPESVWAGLTLWGFGWPLLILGLLLAWRDGTRAGVVLRAALACAVLSPLLKVMMSAPRPGASLDADELAFIGEPVIQTGAMPSGHAMAAFAVAVSLAAAWHAVGGAPTRERWRVAVLAWGLATALAGAVAWSRVAVGAHWPADVLVGSGLGIWVAGWALRAEQAHPWRVWLEGRGGQAFQVGLLVVCSVAWALTHTGLPDVRGQQLALSLTALAVASHRLAWLLGYAQSSSWPMVVAGWWMAALVVAAFWAFHPVDMAALEQSWGAVPGLVWALAVIGWMASYGLRAWRLQSEWRHRGEQTFLTCLRIVLQHNAAVLLTPGRLGEVGYVYLVHRVWAAPMREATLSLVRWRIQDACVLVMWAGLVWSAATAIATGVVCGLALLGVHHLRRAGAVPAWLDWCADRGWGVALAQWGMRLAVLASLIFLLCPGLSEVGGSTALRAAAGAELGGWFPIQGPAGLGPFEAGAWIAAGWSSQSLPPGFAAAVLTAHGLCVLTALGGAALVTLGSGANALVARIVGVARAPGHSPRNGVR